MLSVPLALIATVQLVQGQRWRDYPCSGPTDVAFPGPWDQNNYAPASRTVPLVAALVWPDLNPVPYSELQTVSGNGSLVTYDSGKEVGGIIRFSYQNTGAGMLGISFTESKKFVGYVSDSSNGLFNGSDLWLNVTLTGEPGRICHARQGSERRLPIHDFVAVDKFELDIFYSSEHLGRARLSAHVVKPPSMHCSDELLNRIWYAGAYTLQSNSVPTNTGRQVPMMVFNWANNATLGPGYSIIVDGAKRDRAVWPGDMGIAVPSAFVSTGDLESVRNALQVMFDYQNITTGAFDESGPPLSQKNSDTYHMWAMIGSYNYVLYTNDTAWLTPLWKKYKYAMDYVVGKIDESGRMNVTGTRDWARWQQGFHNTAANVILFQTLTTGSELATWLGETSVAANWSSTASSLAGAINSLTYDASASAYRDNDTSTSLHSQDANSMAPLFSVAPSSQAQGIASALVDNWTPIGPMTPELPYNVSPFISSFELLGRLAIRDTVRALELLRTLWGWIINNPDSTESTLLEGYLFNGSFSYRSDRGYSYDESYVSHAHGWSSSPTSALTHYVSGLDVVSPAGGAWKLALQKGDLTFAEGGFTTILGKFSAKRQVQGSCMLLTWDTPSETTGTIGVPFPEGAEPLQLNTTINRVDKPCALSPSATSAFGERTGEPMVPGGQGRLWYPVS